MGANLDKQLSMGANLDKQLSMGWPGASARIQRSTFEMQSFTISIVYGCLAVFRHTGVCEINAQVDAYV
jgi:hypothetical protein